MTDDPNNIAGFDFGFARGKWVAKNTYVAEPVPTVGVVVFLAGVGEWAITFFPVWQEAVRNGVPLNVIFAKYTLACVLKKIEPHPANLLRQLLATEIIEIICIIHDKTIGENNVCSLYQRIIDRVSYAELERSTR